MIQQQQQDHFNMLALHLNGIVGQRLHHEDDR